MRRRAMSSLPAPASMSCSTTWSRLDFSTAEDGHVAAAATSLASAVRRRDGISLCRRLVAETLPEFVGENEGDLIVETTIDAGLQRIAQTALRQQLDDEGQALDVERRRRGGARPQGGVKALIGGRSYRASPFDRAVKALRQPGSAFKPFVYLAALENGYTPDSVAEDEPITVDGWSPKNHTGTYQGDSDAQGQLRPVDQYRRGQARRGGRPPGAWCARRGGSAFILSCTIARRSRSAPPRSRCSSSPPPMPRSPTAARASSRTSSLGCETATARCSTTLKDASLGQRRGRDLRRGNERYDERDRLRAAPAGRRRCRTKSPAARPEPARTRATRGSSATRALLHLRRLGRQRRRLEDAQRDRRHAAGAALARHHDRMPIKASRHGAARHAFALARGSSLAASLERAGGESEATRRSIAACSAFSPAARAKRQSRSATRCCAWASVRSRRAACLPQP